MVVHLRATGDAPILKQAKFKVNDILTESIMLLISFYLSTREEQVDAFRGFCFGSEN